MSDDTTAVDTRCDRTDLHSTLDTIICAAHDLGRTQGLMEAAAFCDDLIRGLSLTVDQREIVMVVRDVCKAKAGVRGDA